MILKSLVSALFCMFYNKRPEIYFNAFFTHYNTIYSRGRNFELLIEVKPNTPIKVLCHNKI
jgi:hypothetical protein